MRLWRTYSVYLSCLLLLLPAAQAAADSSGQARVWLEKMSQAKHSLNYDGTFVYVHNRQIMTMRISHRVGAYGEYERLVPLNGPQRQIEVISKDSAVSCILPDSNTPPTIGKREAAAPFHLALPRSFEEISQYYSFSLGGQERIANRSTQVIMVKPRDNFRYGYRLWVDVDSGLLIKSDLVGGRGAILEQVMFTSLDIHENNPPPLTESSFSCPDFPEPEPKVSQAAALTETSDKGWRVNQLPPGFEPTEHQQLVRSKQVPIEHILLGDGLATVSVFVEKFEDAEKFVGSSYLGGVSAYGNVIHGHQVTVVGMVPRPTVEIIGQSVQTVP